MKSYNEIREEELIITEKFSNKKLDRYIWFVKFIRRGFNINFLWFLSVIMFLLVSSIFILFNFFQLDLSSLLIFTITHFLYWIFRGKKDANKLIDEINPELDLNIEVLEDIRKERK
jgi:hypothetical protein